ncbi:hypothetical protein H4582DRAFT_2082979 [Lactarius indigo]|nr:hypothetical protein H4582DRAFT_2082979 [Lactarius indigo]
MVTLALPPPPSLAASPRRPFSAVLASSRVRGGCLSLLPPAYAATCLPPLLALVTASACTSTTLSLPPTPPAPLTLSLLLHVRDRYLHLHIPHTSNLPPLPSSLPSLYLSSVPTLSLPRRLLRPRRLLAIDVSFFHLTASTVFPPSLLTASSWIAALTSPTVSPPPSHFATLDVLPPPLPPPAPPSFSACPVGATPSIPSLLASAYLAHYITDLLSHCLYNRFLLLLPSSPRRAPCYHPFPVLTLLPSSYHPTILGVLLPHLPPPRRFPPLLRHVLLAPEERLSSPCLLSAELRQPSARHLVAPSTVSLPHPTLYRPSSPSPRPACPLPPCCLGHRSHLPSSSALSVCLWEAQRKRGLERQLNRDFRVLLTFWILVLPSVIARAQL